MRSFRRNKNENGGLRSSIREQSFKLEGSNHHRNATITASNDSSISNITKLLRRSFPRPYGRSSIRGSNRLNSNSNHSNLYNYNGNDSSTISFQSSMYDSSFQSVDVSASFRSILDDEQYASLRDDVAENLQHVIEATEILSTLAGSDSSNRQEQCHQQHREQEQEQEQEKQSEWSETPQIEVQRTALINRSVFPRPYARVSSMHSLRSDTTDLMINSSHSLSGMSTTLSTNSLDELNTNSTHSLYDLNEEDTDEIDDDPNPLKTELLNLEDQLKCPSRESSSLQNRCFPLTSTHGSSFHSSEPSSSDTTSDYCDKDEYYKDRKEQANVSGEQMAKMMMMIAIDTTDESVPESTARSDTSHNDDSLGRWNLFKSY